MGSLLDGKEKYDEIKDDIDKASNLKDLVDMCRNGEEITSENATDVYDSMGDPIKDLGGYTIVGPIIEVIVDAGGNVLDFGIDTFDDLADEKNRQMEEAGEDPFYPRFATPKEQANYDATQQNQNDTNNTRRPVDPLVIDLDNDGVELLGNKVFFDLNNDGKKEYTSWIGDKDGILVRDINNNGKIDNGGELFGDSTILVDGSRAKDGYEALAELDTNNDGIINQDDSTYTEIKVWIDSNGDAISQEEELYSLKQLGIKDIALQQETAYVEFEDGSIITGSGDVLTEVGDMKTNEIWLNTNPQLHISDIVPDEELLALPEVMGMGKLESLRFSMQSNYELKELVEKYIEEKSSIVRGKILDEILYTWADASNIEKIIGRESQLIDIKKVVVLEQALGMPYTGLLDYSVSINKLNNNYNAIKQIVNRQLVIQSIFSEIFNYSPKIIVKDEEGNTKGIYDNFVAIAVRINDKLKSGYDIGIIDEFREVAKMYELYNTVTLANIFQSIAIISDEREIKDYCSLWTSKSLEMNFIDLSIGSTMGTSTDDVIKGTNLEERIRGQEGDDILIGGKGDDYLEGGAGNDTYIFNVGDGKDVIEESSGEDSIKFGEGIEADKVKVTRSGNDLVLMLKDAEGTATGDQVTIGNYFHSSDYKVEQINFVDGTKWTVEDIMKKIAKLEGTENGETILAHDDAKSPVNQSIYGYGGNDKLYAYSGDDYLEGGKGDDYLEGGVGNDTYIFNVCDGKDVIVDSLGEDSIKFGEDIKVIDLLFAKQGNDLVVGNIKSGDKITIQSWYSNEINQIEQIKLNDDTTLVNTQVDQLIQAMASFEAEKGMSWNDLSKDENNGASEILNQFWVVPTI